MRAAGRLGTTRPVAWQQRDVPALTGWSSGAGSWKGPGSTIAPTLVAGGLCIVKGPQIKQRKAGGATRLRDAAWDEIARLSRKSW